MADNSSPKKPQPKAKPGGAKPNPKSNPQAAAAKPAGKPNAAMAANQQRLQAKAAQRQNDDEHDEDEDEEYGGGAMDWFADQVSWLVSMVFHALLLVSLSLYNFGNYIPDDPPITVQTDDVELEELPEEDEEPPMEFDQSNEEDEPQNEDRDMEPEASENEQLEQDNLEAGADSAADEPEEINSEFFTPPSDFSDGGVGINRGEGSGGAGSGTGSGIGGRGKRRSGALGKGATKKSEEAVEAALKWLANHQLPDGSWNFDHAGGACQGRCNHTGTMKDSRNAATALGVLPFLGAGYTHMSGKYRKTVARGLKYLMAHGKNSGNNVTSWRENAGNHYSHGVVVLALCEAYAMSKNPPKLKKKSLSEMTKKERAEYLKELEKEKLEKKSAVRFNNLNLKRAAQAGLNYIMQVQSSDGGWRYSPGDLGDTSVVGWMVMALKSGHMAGLSVSVKSFQGAIKFLNSVKTNSYGSEFTYMAGNPRKSHGTTSIGLLLRMYTTWAKDSPALADGVDRISGWGPSRSDLYYDYYATQVVHHFGGKHWKRWNNFMREHLINTQSKEGHSKGSWYFKGGHGATAGGRLYNTAMATMILEVYYRHSPIYNDKEVFKNNVTKKVKKGDKKEDKKKDGKKSDDKKKAAKK